MPYQPPRLVSAAQAVLASLNAAGVPACLIGGMVRRQGSRLDVELIHRWGREFATLQEDPDLLRPFENAWRDALK